MMREDPTGERLLNRKKTVAPAQPQAQELPYPNTNIVIRDNGTYPNGDFNEKVKADLEFVEQMFGHDFVAPANGKKITIIYAGGLNYCRGGPGGYTEMRFRYGQAARAEFADELRWSMGAAHLDVPALATQLLGTQLPQWDSTSSPSPFQSDGQEGTEAKITTWLKAEKLPSIDEMDILSIVLEPHLRDGGGSAITIAYNPSLVDAGGGAGRRPPQVGLAHELTHAYYHVRGIQLGHEASEAVANGGRLYELMAVGMPPFRNRPYSENKMRALIPRPDRTQYP